MKIAHNYFVYIIECSDKSYYTSVTNDLDRRIWEHNNNDAISYTSKRRPVTLKYFQRFQDINYAIAFEKQIKGWSRKEKEALFEENWEAIKQLAKSKSSNPPSTSSG